MAMMHFAPRKIPWSVQGLTDMGCQHPGRTLRWQRGRAWWGLCVLLAAMLGALLSGGCGELAEPKKLPRDAAQFRTYGDYFEIDRRDGKGWQRFFIKGVNLAIAKPGYFPGELSATREDYRRWFAQIAEMNVNVIRLYTLHFPVFYQSLYEWNTQHPDKVLYVMHGVWLDEIEHCEHAEGCDYITERSHQLEEEVRHVVDCVHGQGDVPVRFGKAYGIYRTDISPWVMAFLPGHEMDGNMTKLANERYEGYDHYEGRYLRVESALPIETWVARGLDYLAAYDLERYGAERPLGWSNWPALDPIHHPTEPSTFLQDVVDVNFGKFQSKPGFDRGVFVSYHVYPFNPEFIIYGEDYVKQVDRYGKINSYLGYLKDLKAHHKGVPLLIAEYGIPSSQGVAHINPNAYDHGGYDEEQMADIVIDQTHACIDAGAAGVILFEWIDEWFKRTWICTPTMLPADRGPLWYDVISPEESFGIISYYPVPGMSREIDGKIDDWLALPNTFELLQQTKAPLAPVGDGKDDHRTLLGAWAAYDPAYLFFRIKAATKDLFSLQDQVLLIGLSTSDGDTGDKRFAPIPELQTAADLGFESWLVLDGAGETYSLLVDDVYDPTPRLNGGVQAGGIPLTNDNGKFQLANHIINNNAQYIAEGKTVIPKKQFFAGGKLRVGPSHHSQLTHLLPGPDGELEVRLPWHVLWITDPSGHHVLWDNVDTKGVFDVQKTTGVRVLVLSAVKKPDGTLQVVDALPRGAWNGQPIAAGMLPLYLWPGWDKINSEERRKPVFYDLKALFAEDL